MRLETSKILLVLVATFCTSDAIACQCDMGTIDERFEDSTSAFHVLVTATELRPSFDLLLSEHFPKDEYSEEEIAEMLEEMPNYVGISFEVREVFKGESSIPDHLYELTPSPGNCGLGLMAGIEYVIFSSGEPIEFATFCSGSFGFVNAEASEIRPDLERLRELAH